MAKKNELDFHLPSADDLFSTQEEREDAKLKRIYEISLDEIDPFPKHPFKVKEDEDMKTLVDSIKEFGVLTPATVRRKEDGRYELLSGHRRKRACELAGLDTLRCEVVELDKDAATIFMVDSNLQRTTILPSEKAFSYKMRLDAMKRQGQRTDLTSSQVETKLRSDEILARSTNESRATVQRYIRLTNLIPDLLEMVDQKQISFNPAVELSYLKPEEQEIFMEAMDMAQTAPSLSQAQRMKKLSQEGGFTLDAVREIMTEVKKGDLERVTFRNETLRKYFPKSYSTQQMQDTIIKLLEQWQKRKQRDQGR